MIKHSTIFFITAVTILMSCRSTRTIQKAIAVKDTTTVSVDTVMKLREDSVAFIKESYSLLQANRIQFRTFMAKMDVDYNGSDGKKYDVNANVRMYKDSLIWITINGFFGMEGLRAYITKDSVLIMNKLDRTITRRSLFYLQEVTALPLNLSSLQDLIVGNPVFIDSSIQSYSKNQGTISLFSTGEFFRNLFTISGTEKLPLSSKLDDVDEQRRRTCFLKYDEYENKKGPQFSVKREINVSEKTNISIKLNFKQYEFNETLSFPFTIPKNYKEN